ncbi:ETS-related transcription factor Elf-4-like isoform X2 [Gigantopelta aegis]|uniref:ETS-related transcription factor Elf-4-like isoform X2 n=1 Tax=Gigantopelta aegis TaxID=1735272 RepID=UPI001B887A86|nr:ETS-related transcription factor Elf-4-like isoform X2 [Gigantopelta aegis]
MTAIIHANQPQTLPPFGIFSSEVVLQDLSDIVNQELSFPMCSSLDQLLLLETVEVNSSNEFPAYPESPEYQTLESSDDGTTLLHLLRAHRVNDAMKEDCDDDDNLSVMLDYDDLSFLDDDTSDSDTSCSGNESDNVSTSGVVIKQGPSSNIPRLIDFCESESSATTDDENYDKPYCKSRRGAKNILLWKFLLHQLERRPDLLKWTSRSDGVFKFVDTTAVSRLWGQQKRKGDMTFEKLSRGIRHYYKSGLMERVGGSRLMYKFNWHQVPKPFRKG